MYKLSKEKMDSMVLNIRRHTEDYLEKNNIGALVMGISGGIDSALVAALLKPVCDKVEIPLIGRSIRIEGNKPDEVARAMEIGKAFCTNFNHVDLTPIYKEIANIEEMEYPFDNSRETTEYEAFTLKIRRGNIKARTRMLYLYNIASAEKGMVLSTDNLTELLLGFWTLHGDVGDYGPIQQLWKTEVYAIAEHLCNTELADNDQARNALYSCIEANATDGLGITSTDLDQLLPDWRDRHTNTRSGYEEVDDILFAYVPLGQKRDKVITIIDSELFYYDRLTDESTPLTDSEKKVVDRYIRTEFKRNNPYNIPRKIIG